MEPTQLIKDKGEEDCIIVRSSDSISRISKLGPCLKRVERVHNWAQPIVHRDIFLSGWILFVAVSMTDKLGLRIGQDIKRFGGGPMGVFLPAFQLAEWHIPKGELVWEAFRCMESDHLGTLPGFCFQWDLPTMVHSKKDVEHIICNSRNQVPLGMGGNISSVALKTKTYLDNNYQEKLSIPEVAETLGFAHSTMTHYFKRSYGVPPKKYRNLLRLAHAAEMIAHEELQTTHACYASGFDDYSVFKDGFKKRYGVSPSQLLWRRNLSQD